MNVNFKAWMAPWIFRIIVLQLFKLCMPLHRQNGMSHWAMTAALQAESLLSTLKTGMGSATVCNVAQEKAKKKPMAKAEKKGKKDKEKETNPKSAKDKAAAAKEAKKASPKSKAAAKTKAKAAAKLQPTTGRGRGRGGRGGGKSGVEEIASDAEAPEGEDEGEEDDGPVEARENQEVACQQSGTQETRETQWCDSLHSAVYEGTKNLDSETIDEKKVGAIVYDCLLYWSQCPDLVVNNKKFTSWSSMWDWSQKQYSTAVVGKPTGTSCLDSIMVAQNNGQPEVVGIDMKIVCIYLDDPHFCNSLTDFLVEKHVAEKAPIQMQIAFCQIQRELWAKLAGKTPCSLETLLRTASGIVFSLIKPDWYEFAMRLNELIQKHGSIPEDAPDFFTDTDNLEYFVKMRSAYIMLILETMAAGRDRHILISYH